MGKTLADLQSNISISAYNAVMGDIEWCSGYTGFSDDIGEQAGWYLALKVNTSSQGSPLEGVTITATYPGTVKVLEDGQTFIIRLAERGNSIKFTANKEGYEEGRLTLDLSGLIKEELENTCYVSSETTGITVNPLQFGDSKDLSGEISYDSGYSFKLKYRTFNRIPAESGIYVSFDGTQLGESTFYTVVPQDGEAYSEAIVTISITPEIIQSSNPILTTLIEPLNRPLTDRFYCSLNVGQMTFEVFTISDEMPLTFNGLAPGNLTNYQLQSTLGAGIPTVNLFNYAAQDTTNGFRSGYQLTAYTGVETANQYCNITEYIPVQAETTYSCIWLRGRSNTVGITFYDSNKTVLGGFRTATETTKKTFTTVANTAYVRATYRKAEYEKAILALSSVYPSEYVNYGYTVPITVNDETTYDVYVGDKPLDTSTKAVYALEWPDATDSIMSNSEPAYQITAGGNPGVQIYFWGNSISIPNKKPAYMGVIAVRAATRPEDISFNNPDVLKSTYAYSIVRNAGTSTMSFKEGLNNYIRPYVRYDDGSVLYGNIYGVAYLGEETIEILFEEEVPYTGPRSTIVKTEGATTTYENMRESMPAIAIGSGTNKISSVEPVDYISITGAIS